MHASNGRESGTFADQVNRLHVDFVRQGLSISDMRRAQSLELGNLSTPDLKRRSGSGTEGIEPMEGPIEARLVPPPVAGESQIRFFLDGAQRTLPCWRIGLIPINAVIVAAAILRRDEDGQCEIMPGTLRLQNVWLIPKKLPHPHLRELVSRIEDQGGTIVDPLKKYEDDEELYREYASDYGRLVEFAYQAANGCREAIETDLLERWGDEQNDQADGGWIVVDGRLRRPVDRALGLVKQFTESFLAGSDAEILLGLQPGHRTTAFFPGDRFRGGPAPEAFTLWYLRLWDAAGLDARHALVRIEACQTVRETGQIDQLSAWLMAERTPRATADARWASLLYPVHFLERILKRRLEADTRGWPSP